MQTAIIVSSCIAWCIVGYFVNVKFIYVEDWNNFNNRKTDSVAVLLSIIMCLAFPVNLIIILIYYKHKTFTKTFTKFNVLQKLADWHNRGRK